MLNDFSLRRAMPVLTSSALMVLFLATGVIAGEKPQVKFAPGANSASLKGEIQGMDRDVYPITAKAGQTMQVTVSNKHKLALFRIQKPGKEEAYLPKAGEDDDATTWKGVLPVNGTYKIIVGAMKGDDTHYTLDVQITK